MGRSPQTAGLFAIYICSRADLWHGVGVGGRDLCVQTEGNLWGLSLLPNFSSILPQGVSGALGHGWGWWGGFCQGSRLGFH